MISSNTVLIDQISSVEKNEMYNLLLKYFLDVSRKDFDKDLSEKECVMFLRNIKGDIVGFSTLMSIKMSIEGRNIVVVFSGDTVVNKDQRSSFGLGTEIAKYFHAIKEKYPHHEPYYVLTSKGWRTYRILPFFFKQFFPNLDSEITIEIKEVLDKFCLMKFPSYYDSQTGLLSSDKQRQRLHPDSGDCELPDCCDEHVKFFIQQNPKFENGDELACIASIKTTNLTSGMLRFTRRALFTSK